MPRHEHVIEYRFADGHYDRLPELAAELVRLDVDVIVTRSSPGAHAAKRATVSNQLPVVMTNVGDAIGAGIVASLARPGGNITGDTFFFTELTAKRLEVLKDAIPRVRHVAVLANPRNAGTPPALKETEATARGPKFDVHFFGASGPDELDGAFAAMAKARVDALSVQEDPKIIASIKQIAELAARQLLPSIGFIEFVDAGGAVRLRRELFGAYRRAPVFVDKILKGTKPAAIPIERPTRFDFVINMKTANALGVTVSSATRMRADRIIE